MAEVYKDYECCALFKPDLEPEKLDSEVEAVTELLKTHGGDVQRVDRWNKRLLAYPIKGHTDGFYVVYRWFSTVELLPTLDYHLKFNDSVLRYIVLDYTEKERKRRKRLGKNENAQV